MPSDYTAEVRPFLLDTSGCLERGGSFLAALFPMDQLLAVMLAQDLFANLVANMHKETGS